MLQSFNDEIVTHLSVVLNSNTTHLKNTHFPKSKFNKVILDLMFCLCIYLEVLDAISLTRSDLEDFHRGYVRGQTSQALLPTAPDPYQ